MNPENNDRNPQAEAMPSDIPYQSQVDPAKLATRMPSLYWCSHCHSFRTIALEVQAIIERNFLEVRCICCLNAGKSNLMELVKSDARIEVK